MFITGQNYSATIYKGGKLRLDTPHVRYSTTPLLRHWASLRKDKEEVKSSALARVSLFENYVFIRRELAESLQERLLHFIA